jgi:hypothetical protein
VQSIDKIQIWNTFKNNEQILLGLQESKTNLP